MCTMIVDLKPRFWYKTPYRRPLCVAAACVVCFFFALPMVTRGGIYVFQVMKFWIEIKEETSLFLLAGWYLRSFWTLSFVGSIFRNIGHFVDLRRRQFLQGLGPHVWPQVSHQETPMDCVCIFVEGKRFSKEASIPIQAHLVRLAHHLRQHLRLHLSRLVANNV